MKIAAAATLVAGTKIRHEGNSAILGALRVRGGFTIGAYSYLRSGLVRRLKSIGRYCSIGPNVIIGETEHPLDWLSTSPFQYNAAWRDKRFRVQGADRVGRGEDHPEWQSDGLESRLPDQSPVVIGNDVWIAANVVIRCGVSIGDGAVCAAGAVVVRDIPPYTIVGGVPAKAIRRRFSDQTVERLLRLRWWQYDAADLCGLPFHDVEAALDQLEQRIEGGLRPRPVEYRAYRLRRKAE